MIVSFDYEFAIVFANIVLDRIQFLIFHTSLLHDRIHVPSFQEQ
jgi:hypothetical protein